jgi:ribonucleoside-diphosphate reductase alpha chain
MTKSTAKASKKDQTGLKFERFYTQEGVNPVDMFEYELRTSVIKNPTGEKVFEMTNVEVPKQWSQVATDILAQKYFRKAGVPHARWHIRSVKPPLNRWPTAWPIAGVHGANNMATLTAARMRRYSTKN